MNTITLPCQLLCAAAAAYAISPKDRSGQYNPLEKFVDGHWVPDPAKAPYQLQYTAVGFVETPFIVTAANIEAVLIGKTAQGIVVAFRGTLPPALNWNALLDWLQDFMVGTQSSDHLSGKVHKGFLLAFNLLKEGIVSAIQTLDPSGKLPLYITGHSKGGGIAPIAAMYFKNAKQLNITQTITFAGPISGNADFASAYNRLFPNHIRYENYLDIVPLLPPNNEFIELLKVIPDLPAAFVQKLNEMKSLGYKPVGTLMYIHSDGVAKKYSSIKADLLLPVRMAEIGEKMVTFDFKAIGNAHHASCGYRYMKGTCTGMVCPA